MWANDKVLLECPLTVIKMNYEKRVGPRLNPGQKILPTPLFRDNPEDTILCPLELTQAKQF